MEQLEAQGLITRLLRPASAALQASPGKNVGAPVYVTRDQFGPHTLLSIGVNDAEIKLTTHPDREEFLLVNDGRPVRPLILVLSWHSREELLKRARAGALSAADFLAMEMVFNDPVRSFFTMNPGVPHCEVTLPGDGPVPCFFVTESRELPLDFLVLPGVEIVVG